MPRGLLDRLPRVNFHSSLISGQHLAAAQRRRLPPRLARQPNGDAVVPPGGLLLFPLLLRGRSSTGHAAPTRPSRCRDGRLVSSANGDLGVADDGRPPSRRRRVPGGHRRVHAHQGYEETTRVCDAIA